MDRKQTATFLLGVKMIEDRLRNLYDPSYPGVPDLNEHFDPAMKLADDFMERLAEAETLKPQFSLTLEEAIELYNTNDITAKGLVLIYCKLHPEFNPYECTTEGIYDIEDKLFLEKGGFLRGLFSWAVDELYKEKKVFFVKYNR